MYDIAACETLAYVTKILKKLCKTFSIFLQIIFYSEIIRHRNVNVWKAISMLLNLFIAKSLTYLQMQ